MIFCLKKKKKINKKIKTQELAGKFFNIVRRGLDNYAEEKQKELNNKRRSRVRHAFKSINSFKK